MTFDDGSFAALAGTGSIHEHSFPGERVSCFSVPASALLDPASGTLELSLLKGPLEAAPCGPAPSSTCRGALRPRWWQRPWGRHDVIVPGELGAAVVDLLCAGRESSSNSGSPVAVGPIFPPRESYVRMKPNSGGGHAANCYVRSWAR